MLYSWNNASSIFLPQHIFLLDLSRMANCKRTSVALAAWCWIVCLPDWDGVLRDRERFSWHEIRKHNDKSCDTNHHSCTRQFLSTDIFQVLLGKTEQTLKNYRIPGVKKPYNSPCLKWMILYLAGPSPFASKLNSSPVRPLKLTSRKYFNRSAPLVGRISSHSPGSSLHNVLCMSLWRNENSWKIRYCYSMNCTKINPGCQVCSR